MDLISSSTGGVGDRMKNGLKEAWRYLTDWEAVPNSTDPIRFMGGDRINFGQAPVGIEDNSSLSSKLVWPEAFIQRFQSTILCSYRTAIPSDDAQELSSDVGWGCMLRTCQSLLANTLIRLGMEPLDVLDSFLDSSSCPFSIQAIQKAGYDLHHKEMGSWFGPSTAGAALQRLVNEREGPPKLKVLLDQDQVIYQDQVMQLAKSGDNWTPILILVATRLGINQVNPLYFERLKVGRAVTNSKGTRS